jgi:hypothetical protein
MKKEPVRKNFIIPDKKKESLGLATSNKRIKS